MTLPSPSPGASAQPPPDPLNPTSRYSSTIPILLQSTFELPIFKGHLNAFRNSVTAPSPSPSASASPSAPVGSPAPAWATTLNASDAGQKLQDRVTTALSAPPYSFAQLRGGNSQIRTDLDIKSAGASWIRSEGGQGNAGAR